MQGKQADGATIAGAEALQQTETSISFPSGVGNLHRGIYMVAARVTGRRRASVGAPAGTFRSAASATRAGT